MADKELKYKIGITLINGFGDVLIKRLIAYCGSAEAVFKEKKNRLVKIPGVGGTNVKSILGQDVLQRAEEEIAFIEKNGIKPLFYLDRDYPNRLKHCEDAPVMLYCKGNMNLNDSKIISIVGTRHATAYGLNICEKIIHDLAEQSVLIVSGLAYGMDICAHRAALKNNLPTVGALAHGLDRIYPSVHYSTAQKMLGNGGLVTDFLSGTNPDKENFPKRNRIVAGMADAVLVVESAIMGGSLITAEIANNYNRDVFAIPGKPGDEYSSGCNWLIKTNRAMLVESAKDIEHALGWEKKEQKKNPARAVQKELFVELDENEKVIVDILRAKEKVNIDNLSAEAKMPVSRISALLLNLEFKGLIRSLPGKVYAMN